MVRKSEPVIALSTDLPDLETYRTVYELARQRPCRMVFMTPVWALQLLTDSGTENRRIRWDHVNELRRQIRTNNWRGLHQGFGVDVNNNLTDGHHRLIAIVLENVAVPLLMMEGEDPDDRWALDRGKTRTLDQDLHMNGLSHGTLRSAVFKICVGLHGKAPHEFTSFASYQPLEPLLGPGIDYAISISSSMTGAGKARAAPVLGAIAYAYRTDEVKVREFSEALAKGANLSADDAVLTLRNFLTGKRVSLKCDKDRRHVAHKTLCAIRAKMHDACTNLTFKDPHIIISYFRYVYDPEGVRPKFVPVRRDGRRSSYVPPTWSQ